MKVENILTALEIEQSRCLDDADDRHVVADTVHAVLRNQHDALVVREFFAHCTNDGQRLIAFSASNGKVQSQVLEAAYRLAGGRS